LPRFRLLKALQVAIEGCIGSGTWTSYHLLSPDLSPPSSRMAARRGSNAKRMRKGRL
jgi:hypothetical protein